MHLPRNVKTLAFSPLRRGAVAALATTFAIAVAGCGSSATSTKPPAPDNSVATATATGTLTIFVATNLTDAITEVVNRYKKVSTDLKIKVKSGNADDLAEDILRGEQVDVFITDSIESMGSAGTRISTPQVFASDDVVVAVAKGDPGEVDGISRLNDGEVNWVRCKDSIPCGAAAVTALRAGGITSTPNDTVGSVSSIVDELLSGDIDAGVILRSYAVAHPELKIFEFQEGAVSSMQLEVSTITNSANQVGADEFVTYLLGADGQVVVAGAGFTPFTQN